jgi:hypothetical protein
MYTDLKEKDNLDEIAADRGGYGNGMVGCVLGKGYAGALKGGEFRDYLSKQKTNKLYGFSHASELYRPSDRRLSAKLVPALADRGCRMVSATNPHDR